ncbi:MAG: DUF1501 domain-containing protein [Deltaproteobacteria bacterium]
MHIECGDHGMFERTLVVVMGEFGRSPKIYHVPGYPLPGRTHWQDCNALLYATMSLTTLPWTSVRR